MNIIFFTQEDPFYVKVFFDEFFSRFKTLSEIKAIVISAPMGKTSPARLAKQMYDFYGLYDFLRMGCRYAYIKVMGRKTLRKSNGAGIPRTYTVRQVAEAYGLEVIERSDLNSSDFREKIGKYDPDLFISVASPIIFKGELIKLPRLDCINIHNAPLPKYRGMLPNFWQLYHGEKEAGITIHRIAEGIDTGDIIAQHFVPIGAGETLNDLIVKTKKMGALFMTDVIEDYRHGKITYRKMKGDSSYFTFPKRNDVKIFKQKGQRLL